MSKEPVLAVPPTPSVEAVITLTRSPEVGSILEEAPPQV
jgi:hypothetical protein